MPVARDAGGRLSGPGLECKASASEVVTIVIEIGDHFEEVADDDGSPGRIGTKVPGIGIDRSEEHTYELQSLMRISYAVFCLATTKHEQPITITQESHETNRKTRKKEQ